jgi:hypothetical protein
VSFVVLYDACVLYPAATRDFLMRLAATGLFSARWTDRILDECFDNLLENRPDLDRKALERTRQLMNDAVPDALVHHYETLIADLHLPDQGDRHVLAAAIRAGAQVIVTANLKHFPGKLLEQYDIEAQDPDTFTLHLLSLDSDVVAGVVRSQAQSTKRPRRSPADILDTLEKRGLVHSVKQLRELLAQRPPKLNA